MTHSNFIDSLVVAIYLIISFVLGIMGPRILRTRKNAEEDFFLAGRKMPGWLNGISMASTYVNADVAPVYCGIAVVVGLSAPWFFLSRFGLGVLIGCLLFAVRWRQLRIATGPEFFALRFGGKGGGFVRTYNSFYGVFVGMVPWIGAGLLGVHMIFAPVFGIETKAATLAIVLPLLIVYVWISGFSGVLVTDAFQSLVILASNFTILVMVLLHFGGPAGLVEAINGAFEPAVAGQIMSSLPVSDHRVFGPVAVIAWLLVSTLGYGGGVLCEGQRIFSCKSNKEAAKMGIWSQISLFAMLLLLMLPVMGLIALHPEMYNAEPAQREKAYGMLMETFLPVGLTGLALAALLASVMSTISGHLNYGAQTLVNDFWRPMLGHLDDKRALWIGRIMIVFIMLAALLVVYFSKSLIGIAVVLSGLFGSSALFAWGQWWWWRVNLKSWIAATVAGPLVYFGMGWVLGQVPWWQAQVAAGESQAQTMAMVQAIIAMSITTTIWVITTLLTKPEDMEVLKAFYRRARPMGAWGPVRRAIAVEDGVLPVQQPQMILKGTLISILGFSWLVPAVLCCSELFVGHYLKAMLMGVLALGLGLTFKKLFNWYIHKLDEGFKDLEPDGPAVEPEAEAQPVLEGNC